jgi:Gas vesicle protein K
VKKPRRSTPQRRKAAAAGSSRVNRARTGKPRRPAAKARHVTPSSAPLRWNPDPDDVQRSVVKLVLSLIEFIRRLMERQAIRRLEARTLNAEEIENVGLALMKLEETVRQIAKRFKLDIEDLNLDLGPIGRLH